MQSRSLLDWWCSCFNSYISSISESIIEIIFTQLDQENVSWKKKILDQEIWINRIQNEQKRKRKQELNTINQYDMKLINGLNVSYPRV